MRGRLALLVVAAVLAAGCTLPGPSLDEPFYPAEVLGGAPWTELVVEIDHAEGRAPSEAARAHLLHTLRNVTGKERITLHVEQSLPGEPGKRWTAEELVQLERQTRSFEHREPVALLRVLYPAGAYERDGVGGVTIGGPVLGPAVVFLDTLREVRVENLPPLPFAEPAVERMERATLLHEVGHAVGLVDNGLPMVRDREDPEHPGHSRNPKSVMYWRVESIQGLRDLLLADGSVPDQFDVDDREDMRAAGGR